MEIEGKFGNLKKKIEIWKFYKKKWKFGNFTKKLWKSVKDFEIWKIFWNLEYILKFGGKFEVWKKEFGNLERFENSENKFENSWKIWKNLKI